MEITNTHFYAHLHTVEYKLVLLVVYMPINTTQYVVFRQLTICYNDWDSGSPYFDMFIMETSPIGYAQQWLKEFAKSLNYEVIE